MLFTIHTRISSGADLVYRDGAETTTKLWDALTGRFPCGAVVSGLNDPADLSDSVCETVHRRLNVGHNGCAVP